MLSDNFFILWNHMLFCILYTVKTLYTATLYNSNILYNIGSIVQMYQFSLNLSSLEQKFSLTSSYLGTNAIIVKRIDCTLFSVFKKKKGKGARKATKRRFAYLNRHTGNHIITS